MAGMHDRHQKEVRTRVIGVVVAVLAIVLLFTFIFSVEIPTSIVGKAHEAAVCAVPPPGIIAWWTGDTAAGDSVGTNDGTLSGATNAAGKLGNAFSFDGINDYVSIPDNGNFDFGSGAFTVEGWIKTDSATEAQYIFSHYDADPDADATTSGREGYIIGLNRKSGSCGAGKICFWELGIDEWRGVDSGIQAGEWYHLAIVRSGIEVQFYVNGEYKGNVVISETLFNAEAPVIIGNKNYDYDFTPFSGLIDELAVYSRALSSEEITALYAAGSQGKCKEESICYDTLDNDADGAVDCSDNDCTAAKIYSLREDLNTYEVIIREDKCSTQTITIKGSLGDTDPTSVIYPNFNICDSATEFVADQVDVCQDTTKITTLSSTPMLRNTNQKPYTNQGTNVGSVTLLYPGPTADGIKNVSIILTRDISTEKRFPLLKITDYLIHNQRLMLVLDGEYYLLSHPSAALFSLSSLRVTHIPIGTVYNAELYPGTGQYLFTVLGNKQIVVGIVGDKIVISSLPPGEAPAAYVVPADLTTNLEVSFTKTTPVEITSPALGQFTLCQQDNAADVQQALVCRNNIEQFTLQKGNATIRIINDIEYALLYDYVNNQKRVSIFILHPLTSTSTGLNYNDFINSMVAGRRVAVKFMDRVYLLLLHPVAPTLSLLNIKVVAPLGSQTILAPSGSEDAVEFPTLDGGKIFLQRKYGTPPPPFEISAKTEEELEPVDLSTDLFTSFSSLGSIAVEPDFGRITVADEDVTLYQPTFKIKANKETSVASGGVYTLSYKQPLVVGNNLLYYHTAQITGGTPVKTVSFYRMYDLASSSPTHPFNDHFIDVITSGQELALKFGNSFYLLGHQGNPTQVQFYDPAKLTLRTLNNSQSFTVSVTGSLARFTVPEGQIEVLSDPEAGIISFKVTSALELATHPFTDFSTELTTTNRVTVAGTTLRLCYVAAYADTTSARVCSDDLSVDVIVNPLATVTLGNQEYILESNQLTRQNKKVIIRKLISLHPTTPFAEDDWFSFANLVKSGQKPLFEIDGSKYLLSASDTTVQSLRFTPYPSGTSIAPRIVEQNTIITSTATLVLNDRLVVVEQQETNNENIPIRVQFTVPPYNHLPDTGNKLAINTSTNTLALDLVTKIDGEVYTLQAADTTLLDNGLVRLQLSTGNDIIFNRYFAQNEVKHLTLDAVPITITVEQLTAASAFITVKRG